MRACSRGCWRPRVSIVVRTCGYTCPRAERAIFMWFNLGLVALRWRQASALEAAVGKPVVTSNQATIWAGLKALGISAPVQGFGSLLEQSR